MKQRLVSLLVIVALTLLVAIPCAQAAPLVQITDVKTDTMSQWDPVTYFVDVAPETTSTFYPAYSKPSSYIYLKVLTKDLTSGITVTLNDKLPLAYITESTQTTTDGKVSVLKLPVAQFNCVGAGTTIGNYFRTEQIIVKSYIGLQVTGDTVKFQWIK
jgi:hypothetical protein